MAPSSFVQSQGRFFLRTAFPILVAAIAVISLAASFVFVAAAGADQKSAEREARLFDHVIANLQSRVAHDQESATVWDDAVLAVQKRSDDWIDINLGKWMWTYFEHDEAYVVGADDKPVYALVQGRRQSGAALADALPLIKRLRDRLRAHDTTGIDAQTLTLGESDFAEVSGHPSVVSVKPIVSDTGDIQQSAGSEFLHVAVRYLDGTMLDQMKTEYLLDDLEFKRERTSDDAYAAKPLASSDGRTIGYFEWHPFRPGSQVLSAMAPVVGALLAAVLLMIVGFLAIIRRRSFRLWASEAQVRHLAHHDMLTGLMNRTSIYGIIDGLLSRTRREPEPLALLYLDLDRFKEVNDTYGHPAGDELLALVAERLRNVLNDSDHLARLGGDEFLIVRGSAIDLEEVEKLCRQIIEIARRPFEIAGTQVFIGVSIGLSMAPRDGQDRIELMRRADVALYQAKLAGRSAYAVFEPAMDHMIEERRGMSRDLRNALKHDDEIQVFFQPLQSAETGRINGLEALARWNHAEHGWIMPSTFIPIAEEQGCINELGSKVLAKACEKAKAWDIETLAVNVSPVELSSPGYATRVANILMATAFSPTRLELEVTENAFAGKDAICEANMKALRGMGIRFALDDFGTGFSSFGRLHDLQVDRIKIDRSFVQGFGKANGDEAIVRAMVDLARDTGLKTTAEGVETDDQRNVLKNLGCNDLQGYLISMPLTEQEAEEIFGFGRSRSARARM